MKDLSARLRAIVRQDQERMLRHGPHGQSNQGETVHELTYVAEPDTSRHGLDDVAAALGGRRHEHRGSACVVIDRRWPADAWHGRRPFAAYALDGSVPIASFDPRLDAADWASRVVFFDIETTGLGGGAGTIAFLAACGWFDADGFTVRQFFLNGPGGESAMLDALARVFDEASLVVTFNGRAFDVPMMEMRWAFHRLEAPTTDLPHFDMLGTARRLWGRGETADASCTLASLERSVLRFHRTGDVPGFEIPARYFQFLRTGEPRCIEGVLRHNQLDVVSLAAVMARALYLWKEGPDACETGGEQLGLARLYERTHDLDRAAEAYTRAAAAEAPEIAAEACSRLAVLFRRQARYEEAAAAWQGVLACSAQASRPLTVLERRATEALAIHHEHRARDLDRARRFAEAFRAHAIGPMAWEADHRLNRLDRKLRNAKARKEADGRAQTSRLLLE
jgi:uncharacterized protein YprB with RNaseH-like and TPR domain